MNSSLIVACVKRLISVGLHMSVSGDYSFLQEAKARFLRRESEEDVEEFLIKSLRQNSLNVN